MENSTMTTTERINAIVTDIENQYHGNRTAKMRAIFEVLTESGVTNPRDLRQGVAIPELWADTPTGEINAGAIYNAWKAWSDARNGITPTPRPRRTTAPTAAPTLEAVDYNAFTFGVEFECGFKRGKYENSRTAVDALVSTAQRFGVEITYVGSANHTDRRDAWKICTDASLHSDNKVEYMVEVVSPILKGRDGWAQLEKMCDVFTIVGINVNNSCGTHVHLGVKNEVWETLKNVGINYSLAYKAYCKALHKSRRADYIREHGDGRDWAAPYGTRQVEILRTYESANELFEAGGICAGASARGNHYHSARYRAVNYVAYIQRKTLEFRQHQGTVDFRKVQSWLKDKMELITWSRTHVLTEYTDKIEDMQWHSDDTRCNFLMREVHYAA